MENLEPKRVFKYFKDISAIPRGSGNMKKISQFCLDFAKEHSLKAICDDADNVIIYKAGTKGYENAEPVILQGHLDMVCQKEPDSDIDFEKDGIDIFVDGDFIKANKTTLGADNGIAVAFILAILESDTIPHPPIEAVFTTDEEIGMIGAVNLSLDSLTGKRMINIDSENPAVVTVSCAGGSEFEMSLPVKRLKTSGKKVILTVNGLKGGHSGVEIHKGRENANILMGRILDYLNKKVPFDLISVNGGDKGNAIPLLSIAEFATEKSEELIKEAKKYASVIKKELSAREPDFELFIETKEDGEFDVLSSEIKEKMIFTLLSAPNGVIKMSAEIENLVETSLNLGIFKTDEEKITLLFALRSNKQTALLALEECLKTFSHFLGFKFETSGHYPPWEFKENSKLQELYCEKFNEKFGYFPKVEAIHAGLECGIFSSGIEGLDCISIGPDMKDIHTTRERLSISSTKDMFEIVLKMLKELK